MNMTNKYTKQELRRDYEEAGYDRKNLSIKYGVLAAQFSEKIIPHFRFIMTERN